MRYALFILLAFFCAQVSAQNPLQKGYDLLADNQFTQAADYFQSQLEGPHAADAHLGLSYTYSILSNGDVKGHFIKAYYASDDDAWRNAVADAVWSPPTEVLDKEHVAWLEELIDNDYGRLRSLALSALGKHYRMLNDLDKAAEYADQLGIADKWQLAGSFENISESGFDGDYAPIEHPEADHVFTNKQGAKVKWFTVEKYNPGGWLYLNEHLPTNNSVIYAQTFAKSPRARTAQIRFGNSGSAKVWVNDVLVFAESEERDNDLDTYVFDVPLAAGYNRILVQTGKTDKTGSNFLLRLTDDKGIALPDVEYSARAQPYEKGGPWEIKTYESPAERYFLGRVNSGKAHFVDYSALTHYYLNVGRYPETRKLLVDAMEKYPDNVYLMLTMSRVLNRLDDETTASALKERIKEVAPQSNIAMVMRIEDADSEKDIKEMESLVEEYKRLYGESGYTFAQDLSLAAKRNETDKMVKMVFGKAAEEPDNADYVKMKAYVFKDMRRQPRDAIKTLNSFAKKYHDAGIIEQLISLHLDAGQVTKAQDLLERLLAHSPNNTNYYSRLARLYVAQQSKGRARDMLDEAIAIAPYSSNFHNSVGDLYRDMGNEEKARDAYARAIELNPYDYDSRDAIRNLDDEESTAFDALPEVDFYQRFADAPDAEDFPDDNSIILNYDVQHVIHEGGASEIKSVFLVKVFNQEGVDFWKEYTIPIYANQSGVVDKQEVLAPDGSRHDASRSGTNVVFDGLQPGGAILIVMRLKEFRGGKLAGKFWKDHYFNTALPVAHSSYSLLVPPGTEFTSKVTGPDMPELKYETKSLDGRELHVWTSEDRPALEPEATMPSFDDVATTVRVTNIDDWAFIADWYNELTFAKIQVDDVVREKVDELFAGTEGLTEREEVEIIYDYVTGDIRYISVPFLQSNHIPQKASKTIVTSQGDCKDVSSLFVAMCQARGIKANLALISTRDQSRTALAVPGIGFNHCIAYIELEGEEYFVELTDENLPFGTGDWSVNGAFGLVIPRQGESYNGRAGAINPKSRGVNKVKRDVTIDLKDGDLYLHSDNKRINSVASNLRHTYELESQTDREKLMLESMGGRYPRMEMTEVSFDESIENLSNTLSYTYAWKATDVVNTIAGMDLYDIKLSDLEAETPPYLTLEERTMPIDLWQVFQAEEYEQDVLVKAPAGKQVLEIPNDVSINNEYIEYDIRYAAADAGGVKIYRRIRLKNDIVPVKDYKRFREDMLKVVEADKITLAFR